MATDANASRAKITYATMGGERMEELHRELDQAIARVTSGFGKSYPMMIGGRPVRAATEFDDRSPIDTRVLLGRFQSGGRDEARQAVAAAKAAVPGWSARPWREPRAIPTARSPRGQGAGSPWVPEQSA